MEQCAHEPRIKLHAASIKDLSRLYLRHVTVAPALLEVRQSYTAAVQLSVPCVVAFQSASTFAFRQSQSLNAHAASGAQCSAITRSLPSDTMQYCFVGSHVSTPQSIAAGPPASAPVLVLSSATVQAPINDKHIRAAAKNEVRMRTLYAIYSAHTPR